MHRVWSRRCRVWSIEYIPYGGKFNSAAPTIVLLYSRSVEVFTPMLIHHVVTPWQLTICSSCRRNAMAADDLLELSDELIDHIGQLALARHLPSALRLGETCTDLRRRLHAVLLAAEVPAFSVGSLLTRPY